MINLKSWDGFKSGKWTENIDVRDFIQNNYAPYQGNHNFLADVSNKTRELWSKAEKIYLLK